MLRVLPLEAGPTQALQGAERAGGQLGHEGALVLEDPGFGDGVQRRLAGRAKVEVGGHPRAGGIDRFVRSQAGDLNRRRGIGNAEGEVAVETRLGGVRTVAEGECLHSERGGAVRVFRHRPIEVLCGPPATGLAGSGLGARGGVWRVDEGLDGRQLQAFRSQQTARLQERYPLNHLPFRETHGYGVVRCRRLTELDDVIATRDVHGVARGLGNDHIFRHGDRQLGDRPLDQIGGRGGMVGQEAGGCPRVATELDREFGIAEMMVDGAVVAVLVPVGGVGVGVAAQPVSLGQLEAVSHRTAGFQSAEKGLGHAAIPSSRFKPGRVPPVG